MDVTAKYFIYVSCVYGHEAGEYKRVSGNPLDFTQCLEHGESGALSFQNFGFIVKQDTFFYKSFIAMVSHIIVVY